MAGMCVPPDSLSRLPPPESFSPSLPSMSSTSRSLRSFISPFRSRKPPQPPPSAAAKCGGTRPQTPLKTPIYPSTSDAPSTRASERPDSSKAQENVTVTVTQSGFGLSVLGRVTKGTRLLGMQMAIVQFGMWTTLALLMILMEYLVQQQPLAMSMMLLMSML